MADNPLTVDLTAHIDTTLFRDGRPHLRGRRMSVYDVMRAAKSLTVERVAHEFSLSAEQVLAALFYYERNADAVIAFEREAEQQYQHLYNPSDHE